MEVKEPKTVDLIKAEELTETQKKALEWTGKGFDNRTHINCASTGKTIRYQPYRYVVDHENGNHYVRDGKRWTEQGHPIDKVPVQVVAQTKEARSKNDTKLSQ